MKKHTTIIIITLIILITISFALLVVGFSYAFFKASVEGNETAETTVIQSTVLKLEFVDTQIISLPEALPGATATKTFTVENTGNGLVTYYLKLVDVVNTFINDDLVYEITSTNGGGTKVETPVPSTDSKLLTSSIEPGITQVYTIKITFKETLTNQNSNMGAEFTGKLQVDTKTAVYNALLENYTAVSDVGINYNSTTGNGLYYTLDNQYGEDDEIIYYFRGRVDNNWVAFGGFLWRIVRTTSEGGIKLVYSGDGSSTSSAFIGTSATRFNTSYNNKYYVGYTLNTGLDGYTGAQTDSTIKTVVDNWYNANLKAYESYLSTEAIYCADRSSERIDGSKIYYPAYDRIKTNYRPTYACSNVNASRYTVSTETGNGYLQNPIGLLTADEINYAGVRWSTESLNSYIMDNASSAYWWTMSPYGFYDSFASMFDVYLSGNLNYYNVGAISLVRPAVSLKSEVMFSGGDGTKSNPYIIE